LEPIFLGLHEKINIAIIDFKFEILANVINKDTDNVPVTQILDILFQYVSFE
jgi:hypothetical protein